MTDETSMTGSELTCKLEGVDKGDLMRSLLELALQTVLEAERDERIGLKWYERSEKRRDTQSSLSTTWKSST